MTSAPGPKATLLWAAFSRLLIRSAHGFLRYCEKK